MKTPALITNNQRLNRQFEHLQQAYDISLSTYYNSASGLLGRKSQYILVGFTKSLPPGTVRIPANLVIDVYSLFREIHNVSKRDWTLYYLEYKIQDYHQGYSITIFVENNQFNW